MNLICRIVCVVCVFHVFVMNAYAHIDDGLVLHYDFSDVTGNSVPDKSSTGAKAKMMGGAKVISIGKYFAIDLGANNGYLDMTSYAGKAIKALNDHTISCYYIVDESTDITGAGNFVWSFSTSVTTTQTEGAYTAYRVNAQRAATSPNGWGGEVGFEVGSPSKKGEWIHVLYRQTGAKGELFINGKRVASGSKMPVLSANFTSVPSFCFIGKPAFSADNYLKNTLVTDFRVYRKSLSDADVAELAKYRDDIENEYRHGGSGDFTKLKSKIEEVKTFVSNMGDDYAVNAVAELMDEVRLAEIEVERGTISQVLIDKRVEQLTQTYEKCIKTKGFKMEEIPVFVNTEHGFAHPGGMHSKADFDRIKQLLAEGDPTITAAWDLLCANEYASSSVETWPTWEIWRSGSGDNYMNVARGGAMAYQNALRWKIAGSEAHARNGVRILMKWARENDHVGGNSNMSLAFGLYGYALAQAAELLRDYPGWSAEDFDEFKLYIKRVWYPGTIDFLRRRHDTWLNPGNSHGEHPGHYWSNWGLCCALATMSYGVLLDDVHIYNQGVSFFKYDHVGTWTNKTNVTSTICNDGCNEYLGNLIPVLHDDTRGLFGKLGQMQECGRDQGHTLMALGLALDICQMGLTQGDDLYAYMDDRMAAGIEWVAAYNHGGLNNLPWTPYNYSDRGAYLMMGWQQDAPNEGSRGQFRPIWQRAVGYYEGVRGLTPTYAKKAADAVGIDGGGGNYGQNSGGFDHLGFSTLTSYRKKIRPEDAALIVTGKILYKGQTLSQTDLGGLKYTYAQDGTHAIPNDGAEIVLMPQLPEGVADNGNWRWETGETTRNITVKADHSFVYRVHYTCDNGADAVRSFSIAVAGDCEADILYPEITVDGIITADTVITVLYGKSVTLHVGNSGGWTNVYKWDNGTVNTSSIVIPNITSDRKYTCQYTNQGGRISEVHFHIRVIPCNAIIKVNNEEQLSQTVVVNPGDDIDIEVNIPATSSADDVIWSDGSTGTALHIENIQQSKTITSSFQYGGEIYDNTFCIYVYTKEYPIIDEGYYVVHHRSTNTYMTNDGESTSPVFLDMESPATNSAYVWYVSTKYQLTGKFSFMSAFDNRYINSFAVLGNTDLLQPHIFKPIGSEFVALSNVNTPPTFWTLDENNRVVLGTNVLSDYPFELIPVDFDPSAIKNIEVWNNPSSIKEIFDMSGRKVGYSDSLRPGIYFINGKKILKR